MKQKSTPPLCLYANSSARAYSKAAQLMVEATGRIPENSAQKTAPLVARVLKTMQGKLSAPFEVRFGGPDGPADIVIYPKGGKAAGEKIKAEAKQEGEWLTTDLFDEP